MADVNPLCLTPESTLERKPLILRFSVAEQVLAELRRQLVFGEIAAHTPIPEAQCATSLGVSRVPVREAMMQLERDGLLSANERGKSVIRIFSQQDCQEISALRRELEGMAARLAAVSRSPKELLLLRENIEAFEAAQTAEELARLDVGFHELLCTSARQPWLASAWQTIRWPFEAILVRGFRSYASATSVEDSKVSTADHSRIVDAIEARDSKLAETLVRQHIARWEEWNPEV